MGRFDLCAACWYNLTEGRSSAVCCRSRCLVRCAAENGGAAENVGAAENGGAENVGAENGENVGAENAENVGAENAVQYPTFDFGAVAAALRQALTQCFVGREALIDDLTLGLTISLALLAADTRLGGNVTVPREQLLGMRDSVVRAETALNESMCQCIEAAKRLRSEGAVMRDVRTNLEHYLANQ